jgi:hypothetical protein
MKLNKTKQNILNYQTAGPKFVNFYSVLWDDCHKSNPQLFMLWQEFRTKIPNPRQLNIGNP